MSLPRLLVVGEGPTDVGRRDPAGRLNESGVVVILLRRVLSERHSIEYAEGDIDVAYTKDYKAAGGRFQRKVEVILAKECHARIAIVCDSDRHPERLDEMKSGRAAGTDGQRCVVGVAVEMLEAWLLADPDAWQRCFQRRLTLQGSPEALWGDVASNRRPKNFFLNELHERDIRTAQDIGRAYRELAYEVSLERVEKACPAGFGALVKDVQARWFSAAHG